MISTLGLRIALAAAGTGVLLYGAYDHGKTVERGKATSRIERLGNNYIQLAINDSIAHWNEIGYERQRAREAISAAETFINASDSAREEMRERLAAERARTAEADARATEFLNKLERERDEWAVGSVPNDYVCAVYDGVLDIPGCAGRGVAGTDGDDAGDQPIREPAP
ncbi:MAG: hypothetical protein AAFQ22_07120 [Pseudomonadota bacterium]